MTAPMRPCGLELQQLVLYLTCSCADGLPVELWARIVDEAVISSPDFEHICTNSLAELIQVWEEGQHHV